MGLKFRKSIKIAPGVKLNLNKKSTSVTFGTKGAHYTVNSSGKKTASVGIPGTGISYSQSSSSSKKRSSSVHTTENDRSNTNYTNPNGKKWHEKTGWIIFFLIFFFPVGLFLMWKSNWKMPVKIIISLIYALLIIAYILSPKLEQVTLAADTEQVYDINSQIPIDVTTIPDDYNLQASSFDVSGGIIIEKDDQFLFSASVPGEYNIEINIAGVKSNELTLSFEDKSAIAKEEAAEKEKQEAASKAVTETNEANPKNAAPEKQQENSDPIVYITTNGEKYHRGTCRTLNKSKIERHLSEVIGSYEPCGICNPPTK